MPESDARLSRQVPATMSHFAVVSDIHGNVEALQAVLAEIDRLGLQTIYSLGDTIGYGPDPVDCVRKVRERCEVWLMGNHEQALVDPVVSYGFNATARQAIDWTRDQLKASGDLAGIDALPAYHWEGNLLFVHGSAREPIHEYVRETDDSGLSTFDDVVSSLEKDFSDFNICFVGHNHLPFLVTAEGFLHPHSKQREFIVEGEKLYVSVGSVGQPRDGDPRACYCTFDGSKVTYHRVAYDWNATAGKIRRTGLAPRLALRLLQGK